MSVTGSIMAGVGLAGSIGGAAIGSNAANNAANTQANAADKAAQLQYQASQNALDFQKQQWQQSQNNFQPWLKSGANGLANLQYLLGVGPNGAPDGGTAPSGGSFPGAHGGPVMPPGGANANAGFGGVGMMGNPVDGSGAHMGGVGENATAGQPVGLQARGGPVTGNVGIATGPGNFPGARAGLSIPGADPAGGAAPTSGAVPGGTFQFGASPAAGSGTTQLNGQVDPALGSYGSLMQGYGKQFTAPDALTEQNDPGFQARLNLGTDAIQRSAAARGNVLTGGTAKALNGFAQDYASNEYGNVYNRAYNNYATGYNQFEQNQNNQYNRLAALAGIGQQSASQLGMLGQNASNNVSSNLLNTAANMGQQYNNAAAANASGIVGSANAWGGALSNGSNSLQQLMMLNQLYGGAGGGMGNALAIGG